MGAHQIQPDRTIQEAINKLNSLIGNESAVESVVALGKQAIPYLEHFLLDCPPRTISLPRCRTVRALGELGAYSVLTQYFERYQRPSDSAVLFAEDAVRSAAAKELAQVHSEGVYRVLLRATKQRATSGLVRALGSFCRPESVPLLFELLEDDLCRTDAMTELRKIPEAARPYAVLLLRGCTETPIQRSISTRRRHCTLQLLVDFGIPESDWPEIRQYLHDEDLDCFIAATRLGLSLAGEVDKESIVEALIEASARMNWAQELEVTELLDGHRATARPAANFVAVRHADEGEKPNWGSPFWRILYHVLGDHLEQES
jgi:HEAT repeat protein